MTKAVEEDRWSWGVKEIAKDLQFFFVEGDPPHGLIRAEPLHEDLLLTLIAVKPEYQRKGVATRLLQAMEAVAREAGYNGVINFGPKTPGVFKLYEKLGYKEIKRVNNYWSPGVDAVVLFKGVRNV